MRCHRREKDRKRAETMVTRGSGMKSERWGKRLIFLASLVAAMTSLQAYAAQISFFRVQHREYGDGSVYNRLYFEVKDDSGAYVTSKNFISSVVLKNPSGTQVSLGTIGFYQQKAITGYFDATSGSWHYDSALTDSSYFSVNFSEALATGTYTLTLATSGGSTLTSTFQFDGVIDFPTISSDSFQITHDDSGNIFWNWSIPDSFSLSLLPTMTVNSDQQVSRQDAGSSQVACIAYVEVYSGGNWAGYLTVALPALMGHVMIPSAVVQQLKTVGDEFHFLVQLRNRDNSNRSNSIPVTVASLPPTVNSQSKVVVIPLD